MRLSFAVPLTALTARLKTNISSGVVRGGGCSCRRDILLAVSVETMSKKLP